MNRDLQNMTILSTDVYQLYIVKVILYEWEIKLLFKEVK